MVLLAGALLPLLAAAAGETAEAPPAADEARLFRGCGAIVRPEGTGNRKAATVGAPAAAVMGNEDEN